MKTIHSAEAFIFDIIHTPTGKTVAQVAAAENRETVTSLAFHAARSIGLDPAQGEIRIKSTGRSLFVERIPNKLRELADNPNPRAAERTCVAPVLEPNVKSSEPWNVKYPRCTSKARSGSATCKFHGSWEPRSGSHEPSADLYLANLWEIASDETLTGRSKPMPANWKGERLTRRRKPAESDSGGSTRTSSPATKSSNRKTTKTRKGA